MEAVKEKKQVGGIDQEGFDAYMEELEGILRTKPDGKVQEAEDLRLFASREEAWKEVQRKRRMGLFNRYALDVWAELERKATNAGRDQAWDDAIETVSRKALEAMWRVGNVRRYNSDFISEAILYARMKYICAGLEIQKAHKKHLHRRMSIWRHGYAVLCDMNGVLYCYLKDA